MEEKLPDNFLINLPPGFRKEDHLPGLRARIKEMYPDATYNIENINLEESTAWAVRERGVSEVRHNSKIDAHDVDLVKGTKIGDGERIATKYEAQFPGYTLTDFEPHLEKARLTRLSHDERHARDTIANVLRAKPWDVKVRGNRTTGGFDMVFTKKYVKYTPSAHDEKLQEAVETAIGEAGWYISVDAKRMTARILPGDPPTFEKVYKYDFKKGFKDDGDLKAKFTVPLGVALAKRGEDNFETSIDFSDDVGLLLVGLAGSGKSATTQAIIFGLLSRGWRLALINTVDKATDFAWAKPYVAENMWGCDSVAQSVTVAKLVIEEGARLGVLLNDHGVSKWQELPADVRRDNPPLVLIADELATLLSAPKMPAGLTKEQKQNPEFVKMQQDILETGLLVAALSQIPAVYRAAGIRTIYLTQQPNERYGFSTKLKGNLPHRTMLGTNPSQAEKGHAFRTPEKVPDVPRNIMSDPAVARGVGLSHLSGQDPHVIKGYFAPLDVYVEEAERRGFPKTLHPEPTQRQIERMVPQPENDLDDDGDDHNRGGKKEGFGHKPRKLESWEIDPETGEPWKDPRQRANAARHAATVAAKTE